MKTGIRQVSMQRATTSLDDSGPSIPVAAQQGIAAAQCTTEAQTPRPHRPCHTRPRTTSSCGPAQNSQRARPDRPVPNNEPSGQVQLSDEQQWSMPPRQNLGSAKAQAIR